MLTGCSVGPWWWSAVCRDDGMVTSCPEISVCEFRFRSLHIWAFPELDQLATAFHRGPTVVAHWIVNPIFPCCSFHPALAERSAWSVPFRTPLCNRHGRKCIVMPQATRWRVNISTTPCLFLVCLGVIALSVCALLHTWGRIRVFSFRLIMHTENGRKQKRNLDVSLAIDGSVNRMTTKERSSPCWMETHGHCRHTGMEDFSSFPPLHWWFMTDVQSLQKEELRSHSSSTFQPKRRKAVKPLSFQRYSRPISS